MRITRLYHPEDLNCGETVYLSAENSAHLIRVLRSRIGSEVILFNGHGSDYLCRTLDTNAKKTLLSVESRLANETESPLRTTLIQGLSRHDRMDQTIQKSVELGVDRIIPVLCQRSNSKLHKGQHDKKWQHWCKVATSACEQSGRSVIPEINEITSFQNMLRSLDDSKLKIALNPAAENTIASLDKQPESVAILIGPEGGLNEQEVEQLTVTGFHHISFGPRILRTETAGPAVLSVVQCLWGDI